MSWQTRECVRDFSQSCQDIKELLDVGACETPLTKAPHHNRALSMSLLRSRIAQRCQFPIHHVRLTRPMSQRSCCGADHRELAQSHKLLTSSLYSPGSPLFLPNGADMMNKLAGCLRAHYPQFGFREVITPTIYKRSLWEKSGHWDNYAEDMFQVTGRGASGLKAEAEIGENEEFGLKPMNCPGHCLLFGTEKRSYRDLPIRYADFSPLHRNEISGALSGLTRVRRFHQDDGHIFCRPSQIESEIIMTMDFIRLVYETIFDLGEYRLVLSTRPEEQYIGTVQEWDRAEQQLKAALDNSGRCWSVNEGDGAFYGPKIDIILKDSDGKEHQTATIQLDFQLPQRFELEYTAPAPDTERLGLPIADADAEDAKKNGPVTPVLIHRAVLGSLERFLALLIEHYNGCYPFWISPHPVTILSISQTDEELRYVDEVAKQLNGSSAESSRHIRRPPTLRPTVHVEVDTSARSVGKKIREAKTKGFNFIIVVGPQEVRDQMISLQISNQRNPDQTRTIMKSIAGYSESDGDKLRTTPGNVWGLFKSLQNQYL